jgi:hypothetical protein
MPRSAWEITLAHVARWPGHGRLTELVPSRRNRTSQTIGPPQHPSANLLIHIGHGGRALSDDEIVVPAARDVLCELLDRDSSQKTTPEEHDRIADRSHQIGKRFKMLPATATTTIQPCRRIAS